MSRTAVRQAVAAFISGAGITGLQQVYAAMPTLVPGELINLAAGGGAGAIAWLHLDGSDEDRWALPSRSPIMPGGTKAVHYQATVMVAYQYLVPSAQQSPAVAPDGWVLAEDAILQAIVDRIHTDPMLGTGPNGDGTDLIFEAAQRPNSLKISADEPYLEAGKVLSYHAIEFPLTEVITA